MVYGDVDEIETMVGPNGALRTVVPYDDYDGISLVADHASLLARYRQHDLRNAPDIFSASVAARPIETLLTLANAHEVISWGTHQSPGRCVAVVSLGPFSDDELRENGVRSSLDAGCLTLGGTLVIAAWHSFTYGADYRHGELEAPRIELPPGHYRVTVHRPFGPGDEQSEDTPVFLVALVVAEPGTCPELREVPGADGWFA